MNTRASAKPVMDQATAREWFNYDPETGILTWRKAMPRGGRVKVGQEAGSLNPCRSGKVYRIVSLSGFGRHIKSHRIIWCWMTGHFPRGKEEIDHEDGNGINNRWDNLRLVSGRSEQNRNQRLPKDNTTGFIGVSVLKSAKKKRYRAYISINKTCYDLGRFAMIEDAVAARKAASEEFGFHPNHGQRRPL